MKSLLTNKSPEDKRSKSSLFPKLSWREKEILQLIMDEFTSIEIAEKLYIPNGTVETHRRNIINKLGVSKEYCWNDKSGNGVQLVELNYLQF